MPGMVGWRIDVARIAQLAIATSTSLRSGTTRVRTVACSPHHVAAAPHRDRSPHVRLGLLFLPAQPTGKRFEAYTQRAAERVRSRRETKWARAFSVTKAIWSRTDRPSSLWLFWRPAIVVWLALLAFAVACCVVAANGHSRRSCSPQCWSQRSRSGPDGFGEVFAVYSVALLSLPVWWAALRRKSLRQGYPQPGMGPSPSAEANAAPASAPTDRRRNASARWNAFVKAIGEAAERPVDRTRVVSEQVEKVLESRTVSPRIPALSTRPSAVSVRPCSAAARSAAKLCASGSRRPRRPRVHRHPGRTAPQRRCAARRPHRSVRRSARGRRSKD